MKEKVEIYTNEKIMYRSSIKKIIYVLSIKEKLEVEVKCSHGELRIG